MTLNTGKSIPVRNLLRASAALASSGSNHPSPEYGIGDALEVVEDDWGGTYRAVYTVRFANAVYVLHAFQKKAKRGKATPRKDIELVKTRLKQAKEHHKGKR